MNVQEAIFSKAFYANPTAMQIVNIQTGEALEVNTAFCRIAGYSEEFLHNIKAHTSNWWVDPQASKKAVEHLTKDKFIHDYPMDMFYNSGEIRNLLANFVLLEDGDNNLAIVSFTDVTELNLADEALRASEDRYRDLVENCQNLICTHDLEGRILSANPWAAKILGYELDTILQMNIRDFLAPEERGGIESYFVRIRKRGVAKGKLLVQTATGERRIWEYHNTLRTENVNVPVVRGMAIDITEHKRIEQKLDEERILLRTLIDNLPDRIYVMDAQGRKIISNTADWQASGGKSMEDILGKTDFDTYPPELAVEYWAHDKAVIDSGLSILNFEEPGRDSQGNPVRVLTSKVPLRDRQGKIIGLVGIGRDITERKQAEILQNAIYRIAQTAEQSETLNSLYPSIHAIIQEVMVADNFYIALYDEEKDLLSFPYSVDEVDPPYAPQKPSKGLTEYVLRTAKSLLCDEALFEDLKQRGETELVGVNSPIWLGVPLLIEGKAIGVMTVQDYHNARAYSEREQRILEYVSSQVAMAIHHKQAEQALRESEERYRRLVETMPDGLIIHSQGRVVFANPASAKIGGATSPAELIGKPVIELVHPAYRELSMKRIQQALRTGVPTSFAEEKFIRLDGILIDVEVIGIPFSYANQPAMLTVFNDITERKQIEQQLTKYADHLEEMVEARTRELRAAEEQLVRHERLAVLGQLAGSVGHELRNPLAVIQNAVYLLKLIQPEADDKVRQYHGIIEQEARTAAKIITDLLDFTRIKSVEQEMVAVSELIRQTLARYPAPSTVTVALDLPADLPLVFADPQHVLQVLNNLIVNACQAMPAGGQLTLSARWQEQMVALTVTDTGVGISPENMKKLFEPLFTTKPKGIGLGLALSQNLVEANGGRIEVQSEPGQGSIFTVYLPVSKE